MVEIYKMQRIERGDQVIKDEKVFQNTKEQMRDQKWSKFNNRRQQSNLVKRQKGSKVESGQNSLKVVKSQEWSKFFKSGQNSEFFNF